MSIRQRKDTDKWVVDYKDQEGKRRLKTFRTKTEASAWWRKAGHEVSQGTHTADSASITVARAAELWIERAVLEDRERATIQQYRQHVDLHIVPEIGNAKLSRLTRPAVESFRDGLLKTKSRALSKKVLTSLKGIIKEAMRRGYVAQNVAQDVTVRISSRHRKPLEVGQGIPTKAEVNALVAATPDRWQALLRLALFTGMRASELRGLTWDAIDFNRRIISVKQRADRFGAMGSPKSAAAYRDIPVPMQAFNALRAWRKDCPKGDANLVFPNGRGNVESLSNITVRFLKPVQVVCEMVDNSGKHKYGMHAFRHFYASWLIDREFSPKRVQTLMGHSSIQVTFDIYGHLFPNLEDDHKKLDEAELVLVA